MSFSQKLQELYIRQGSRLGVVASVVILISMNVVVDVIESFVSRISDVSLVD